MFHRYSKMGEDLENLQHHFQLVAGSALDEGEGKKSFLSCDSSDESIFVRAGGGDLGSFLLGMIGVENHHWDITSHQGKDGECGQKRRT